MSIVSIDKQFTICEISFLFVILTTDFRFYVTVASGSHFICKHLTIRNTAGPTKGQALALMCSGDLSVFYNCSIEGYQDTLWVRSGKQFYRECDVYGTIDFIFGNAVVVLQKCNLYARRPSKGNGNEITAQGRTNQGRTQ